jgi:hypothetical protein
VAIDQIIKDQVQVLDYMFDASRFLVNPDGTLDTIASVSWTIPTQLVSPQNSHTSTTATIWLAGLQNGGVPSKPYSVTCTITTLAGRIIDKSVPVIYS